MHWLLKLCKCANLQPFPSTYALVNKDIESNSMKYNYKCRKKSFITRCIQAVTEAFRYLTTKILNRLKHSALKS